VKGAYHSRSVVPTPGSPPWRARLERLALGAALAAALALSAAALPARVVYLLRLAAAPDASARGALAADERISPLAAAGQVRWRAELARQRAAGATRLSGSALAWTFFADQRPRVAPGTRIFLARPNDLLYQLGNFLLFPARLEIAPRSGARLASGEDLVAAAAGRACDDREWLRASGYVACIETRGSGLVLVPVAGTAP
jgi:hypothetical protein